MLESNDKKFKYLRLGYSSNPHTRISLSTKKEKKKIIERDCPGGNQNCINCGSGLNIVSFEMLLSELKENSCKGSSCDHCGECLGV